MSFKSLLFLLIPLLVNSLPQRTLPQTHYLSLLPPETRVIQSLNKFGTKLFNVMNEYVEEHSSESPPPSPTSTDLLYSPITVFTSLGTLRAASYADAHQELTNLLSLSKLNTSVLEQGLSTVLKSLSTPTDEGSINLITRLFLDLQFHPDEDFANRIHDRYYSDLLQTSFSNATGASMFVNHHMFKTSHGLLEHVLAVDDDDEEGENGGSSTASPLLHHLVIDGGLMLVSGFTLEADFDRPFTPLLTRPEPFYREDGSVASVNMMHRDGFYYMAEIPELNATALSIPYKMYRYSLNIILPEEGISLQELETNIESFPLLAVLSRLNKKYVQVSLPKFQIDMSVDLIDPLEKLGVTQVFSEDGGEVGGIVDGGNEDLYLTNAVSKAVLDVSEGGSRVKSANFVEAVPATARHLTPFTVNRPFVFFVSDQMLRTVLLVGRKVF